MADKDAGRSGSKDSGRSCGRGHRPGGKRYSNSNIRMFWIMLAGAVFRRRSRAAMAVIASLVGSATLFCLISVCVIVPRQMAEEMQSYGANLIVKSNGTGKTADGIQQAMIDHTTDMVTAYGQQASWAAYRYENVRIHSAPYQVAGIDPVRTRGINTFWSLQGSMPQGKNQILIGSDVARALSVSVGNTIKIGYRASDSQDSTASSDKAQPRRDSVSDILDTGGKPFSICGIVDTGGAEDSMIYMTNPALESLTGRKRGADVIEYASAAQGQDLDRLVRNINDMTSMNVTAQKVAKISAANASIITMLTTLFWIISLVILALTIVGVSTTMASIVSQRRSEIGLRKALGATSAGISAEFQAESAIYGFVGGILGIGVGYGVSAALTDTVFQRSTSFSWALALLCLAISVAAAVAASWIPIRTAVKIDPAVVLSDE